LKNEWRALAITNNLNDFAIFQDAITINSHLCLHLNIVNIEATVVKRRPMMARNVLISHGDSLEIAMDADPSLT
jgi:hypothetical protein